MINQSIYITHTHAHTHVDLTINFDGYRLILFLSSSLLLFGCLHFFLDWSLFSRPTTTTTKQQITFNARHGKKRNPGTWDFFFCLQHTHTRERVRKKKFTIVIFLSMSSQMDNVRNMTIFCLARLLL